jgi:diguanylate cyclase (GGDEF)-like protein
LGLYKTVYALIVCLALSLGIQAQQYVFRAYGQAEGLKNLTVNASTMDESGFLWVATEDGVYRFLGSRFERLGPEHGIAELESEDIVADSNGTIWVGTDHNLYRWDGQRFLHAGQDPIPIPRIRLLAVEDAHHLLVVDKHRLYRLEHDEQGRMLSYRQVIPDTLAAAIPGLAQVSSVSVVNDPSSGLHIWIGCGKQLCSWQDGEASGRAQPKREDLTEWSTKKGISPDNWESVLMDRSGMIWAAGQKHVMVLPNGATHFADRSIPGSDPENVYGHAPLVEDPEGRVLAPVEGGIARWEGTRWRLIGQANGLQRNSHTIGMTFDAAGDLWMGGTGDGVHHWLGYRDWEAWGEAQGLPSSLIWVIRQQSSNRVLAGTDDGLAWVNPQSGLAGRLSSARSWTYGQVDAIGDNRDGSLWAGTISGAILRIDPQTGETKQTGRVPPRLDYALEDSAGRLFITTTTSGIYLREAPGEAPRRVAAADALLGDSNRVNAACGSPDRTLWFLANNRLVRELDGKWSEPPIDGLPQLNGSLIAANCAADGTIWVTGENAGVFRLTPSGDRLKAWQLDIPADLRSLSSVAILVDHRGWVWLGTDAGLLVWNGQRWRQMTEESGLIWNDVDQGVLTESPDGSLWVGTSGGLAHLLHPEHVFDTVPLDLSITGIQRGDALDPALRQITLPWAARPLYIQFSSSSMRNRGEMVFRYHMAGLQPDWIDSHSGIAVFSALPPGSYTFEAMASNPSLNAYSATVQVKITILPPWWRSNWFISLCGVAVVLIVMAFVWIFERQLRARSRHLEWMVSERTKELEASREQLRIQATYDGLTGMLNRMAVLHALTAELDRAHRDKKAVAVALVDLDHFKLVNDEYGHPAGDEALLCFAGAVGTAIRAYDHAGRYGGEEFLLVLTQLPREIVEQRLTSLHAAISNLKVCAKGSQFKMNCSMGATIFDPSNGPASVEALLATADQALYAAKAKGRNCVVFRLPPSSEIPQDSDAQLPNPQ